MVFFLFFLFDMHPCHAGPNQREKYGCMSKFLDPRMKADQPVPHMLKWLRSSKLMGCMGLIFLLKGKLKKKKKFNFDEANGKDINTQ